MHNNYEDKYERFLASYKKKYNTTNESEHMTKMWQKYWKLCIENIKSKDWKRKRRELLEKYKLEASVSQSTSLDSNKDRSMSKTPPPKSLNSEKEKSLTMSSAEVVAAIAEISRQPLDNFTVEGAVSLLEEISESLGDIKDPANILLSSIRTMGLNKKAAMSLISKEENILLMNIIFEKILLLSQAVPAPKVEFFKKGIAWGLHLIKYAKDFKEEDKIVSDTTVRFDLNLFAQQTYNHEPNWILETLEQSLEYVYGAKPSSDILKQMFANVSAIHMNMASNTPYLMSGSSTASGLPNNPNPGIVTSQIEAIKPSVSTFSSIPLTPLIPSTTSFTTTYPYPTLSTPLIPSLDVSFSAPQSPSINKSDKTLKSASTLLPPPSSNVDFTKSVPVPVQPPVSTSFKLTYKDSPTRNPSSHLTSNPPLPPEKTPPPLPPSQPPPPLPLSPDSTSLPLCSGISSPTTTSTTTMSSFPPNFLSFPPTSSSQSGSSSFTRDTKFSSDMVNTIINLAKQSSHLG
ncbi:UNVERIFIED_CONTAM: hypothetical protein RMT77_017190 [Armadillidium vulgare]